MAAFLFLLLVGTVAFLVMKKRKNYEDDDTEQGVGGSGSKNRDHGSDSK